MKTAFIEVNNEEAKTMEKLFRVKEVAMITGEDVQTVYHRIREGEISSMTLGKRGVRVAGSSLRKCLKDNTAIPANSMMTRR
jgi:hypothetical protein